MAKVTIAGNSYVITSDAAMADLEAVRKYRPSALALTDEETKEPHFKVGLGSSSVNDYGISFGGVSNSDDKLATATLPIPPDTEDAKEYVLDKAGLALASNCPGKDRGRRSPAVRPKSRLWHKHPGCQEKHRPLPTYFDRFPVNLTAFHG